MIEHPICSESIGFIQCAHVPKSAEQEFRLDARLHRLEIRFQRSFLQIDACESGLVQCRCDFEREICS